MIRAWCHLYGVVCCNNSSDRDTRKRPKCCFVDRPIAWSVERITEVNVCFVTLLNGHLEFKQEHVDIETNTNIMVSVYKLLS